MLSLTEIPSRLTARQIVFGFFRYCGKFQSGKKNGKHSLFEVAPMALKVLQNNSRHTDWTSDGLMLLLSCFTIFQIWAQSLESVIAYLGSGAMVGHRYWRLHDSDMKFCICSERFRYIPTYIAWLSACPTIYWLRLQGNERLNSWLPNGRDSGETTRYTESRGLHGYCSPTAYVWNRSWGPQ